MPAGFTLLCEIWDYQYIADDDIGGALPSGTAVHENVPIRIQANRPTQAIREQGITGIDTYVGLIGNYTVNVENNNEILVTAPTSSPWYNKRFRIIGDPQRTSLVHSDARGFLLVNLQRIEQGRTIQ